MPVKNAMPFLTDCLLSIQNQNEKNWELIAVDDSSTDESFSILEKSSKTDTRIKVYKNTGKGITPALKLGYEKANGHYITRMDADDLMPVQKLEKLKKAIEGKSGVVSTGLVEYFPKTEIKSGFKKYEEWLNTLTASGANFKEIYKECVIPSPCWMMHRSDFEKIGAFNAATYPEDYDLCFRMYQNDMQVIGIKEMLHQWRDYPTRTSRTDPNYADNRFLNLKIKYFFEIDRDKNRPLVIWGAGTKGKLVAKKLIEKGEKFTWIAESPKKQGKEIYGELIYSVEELKTLKNPQVITLVAGEKNQLEITNKLKTERITESYFFC